MRQQISDLYMYTQAQLTQNFGQQLLYVHRRTPHSEFCTTTSIHTYIRKYVQAHFIEPFTAIYVHTYIRTRPITGTLHTEFCAASSIVCTYICMEAAAQSYRIIQNTYVRTIEVRTLHTVCMNNIRTPGYT